MEDDQIISLEDIFNFMGSEVGRPFIEGNRIVKANHICDLRILKGNPYKIRARCLQGSNVSGLPHTISIEIKLPKSNVKRQIKAECTCKAGIKGECKHTTAVLIKLERMRPEDVTNSCTDFSQKWGKEGRNNVVNQFQPIPIREFCHLKKRKSSTLHLEEISEDTLFIAKRIIYEGCSSTCMVKLAEIGRGTLVPQPISNDEHTPMFLPMPEFLRNQLTQTSDLQTLTVSDSLVFESPELADFYATHIYTLDEDVENIYQRTAGQDNFVWRKERQIRITGSTAHRFYSKRKSISWESRFQQIILPKKPFMGNSATSYGLQNEARALEILQMEFPNSNILTRLGLCINKTSPMFGYSPDGLMDNKILLEVKCPLSGEKFAGENLCDKLKFLCKSQDIFQVKETHSYYTQIQMGLFTLNLISAKLIIYFNIKEAKNEGIVIIDVPRNEQFCLSLISTLKTVYLDNMLPYLVKNRKKLLISSEL